MWWWTAWPAWADPDVVQEVILQVGVDRAAGVLSSIAADGAAGLCVPGAAVITCPATGPVSFRWAGAAGYELIGDVTLLPGDVGQGWVLAIDDPAVLDALDPLTREAAYAAFVRT
ncbi:MAG: hypothetical protein H0V89_01200, partial [Deltaproteobacteria bacterium]|nr:hypothetical protein [Deltaproteobacteria bacterium]